MPEDLQPQRSWDELLATSVRRGRVLRRRRRAAMAVPSFGAVAAVASALVLLSPGPGRQSLEQVTTDPTPVVRVTPSPEPNVLGVVEGPRGVIAAAAGTTPTASGASPVVPTVPRPDHVAGRTLGADHVVITDQRGDGETSSVYGTVPVPGTGSTSSDDLDILGMDFRAVDGGLQLTMTLAGDHRADATYSAFLTDRTTGCRLTVYLGGSDPDGFFSTCGEAAWHQAPNRIDPSGSVLQAFLPWSLLHGHVEPQHVVGELSGQSSYTNQTGGTMLADSASTTRTLGPVR